MKKSKFIPLFIIGLLIALNFSTVFASYENPFIPDYGQRIHYCMHCGEEAGFIESEEILIDGTPYIMLISECHSQTCGDTSIVLEINF